MSYILSKEGLRENGKKESERWESIGNRRGMEWNMKQYKDDRNSGDDRIIVYRVSSKSGQIGLAVLA